MQTATLKFAQSYFLEVNPFQIFRVHIDNSCLHFRYTFVGGVFSIQLTKGHNSRELQLFRNQWHENALSASSYCIQSAFALTCPKGSTVCTEWLSPRLSSNRIPSSTLRYGNNKKNCSRVKNPFSMRDSQESHYYGPAQIVSTLEWCHLDWKIHYQRDALFRARPLRRLLLLDGIRSCALRECFELVTFRDVLQMERHLM